MGDKHGLDKGSPYSDENEFEYSTDSISKTAFLRPSSIVQSFLRVSDIGAQDPSSLIVRSKRCSSFALGTKSVNVLDL